MIRHIVLWKFLDRADGRTKAENVRAAKARLEALQGKIPEILSMEVGLGVTGGTGACDLGLNATFASEAALGVYQQHPAHVAVASYLKLVRSDRWVVDYELPDA